MIFWTIVGIAIGYFFKPQLDRGVQKVIRYVKDRQNGGRGYGGSDD